MSKCLLQTFIDKLVIDTNEHKIEVLQYNLSRYYLNHYNLFIIYDKVHSS